VTPENLAKFFEENSTYEYKGAYFFKDIKDEKKDNESHTKVWPGIIEQLYNLMNNLIAPKFFNTFNYNPINYFVGFSGLEEIIYLEGIELNKTYEFKFKIDFRSPDTKIIYFEKKI